MDYAQEDGRPVPQHAQQRGQPEMDGRPLDRCGSVQP